MLNRAEIGQRALGTLMVLGGALWTGLWGVAGEYVAFERWEQMDLKNWTLLTAAVLYKSRWGIGAAIAGMHLMNAGKNKI
ncbi:MAG: hypothetical protein AAB955_01305 [Patescibacteria group bacterium]